MVRLAEVPSERKVYQDIFGIGSEWIWYPLKCEVDQALFRYNWSVTI